MPLANPPISVLFRCDGGPVHGFGHVSRCVTLGEAFVAAENSHLLFQTYSPDGAARKFIVDHGFTVVDAADVAGSGADLKSLRSCLQALPNPRIVVIDSRDVDSQYCQNLRDLAVVVCLDDEDCRDLACDILVNSHPWVDDADYPANPARTLLTGPRYNTLSLASFYRTSQPCKNDVGRILITLGGEDPHDHTSWIIESCADLLEPFTVDVIVGPAHPDPQNVEAVVARHLPSANLAIAPSGLGRFIQEADIAISAGGITCYELAAAGVPTLVVMVEDHQDTLVTSLEEHGCLMRLGGYDDLSVETVRNMLASILADKPLRSRLSAAGADLFEGPGGAEIVERAARLVTMRRPGQNDGEIPG